MKLKLRGNSRRFSNPTVLKGDAPFLRATVDDWDRAFTGNMDRTLAQLKQRALDSKVEASKATTSDLATFVGKRLTDND